MNDVLAATTTLMVNDGVIAARRAMTRQAASDHLSPTRPLVADRSIR